MSKKVKTSDWMPNHDPLDYPIELYNWINSINTDFRTKEKYKPFELYKKQAKDWLKDTDDITDYHDQEEQVDFILREYMRCKQNTLYALNKYHYLKDGSADNDGGIKYIAWEAQEIIIFLTDCRYSLLIGKPRQIGFTSVMGGVIAFKINCNKSFFTKFITHSREKGEEIFRDKIRWSFGKLPDWMKHEVYNDAADMLSLRSKTGKKGQTTGANSMVQVSTPAVDAINGGSPNLVMIDEIGIIDFFSEMVTEGRPTLYFYNPATKKMEIRRQLVGWGTSVYDKDARQVAVFEKEFKAALNAFREKHYHYGIIPVFFNAYAREGMTDTFYKNEKKSYYAKGTKASKIQFHQHYPMNIDDMFIRDDKTIVPHDKINRMISKIHSLREEDAPQYGYFEPIFDTSKPTPDGDVPYKVVGASWIPSSGFSDERTTTCVVRHPNDKWKDRYYQGTDPINSETGHSKMGSVIWDAYENTMAAAVFHRVKTFKETYLQCLLLGLYYDKEFGCKELVESNIGDMYVDYKDTKGFIKTLTPNGALPKFLQTGTGKWWGISNRTNTAGRIANKIIEMVDDYMDNIYLLWFHLQLKTFVEKPLKNSQSHRQTRFQANDLRYDYDDIIFAGVLAYINAQCYDRYEPKEKAAGEIGNVLKRRLVQDANTGWSQRLADVDSDGKVVRYISR